METSDYISALALLVAGGALALEVRRWFESGPKLHLSLMADAKMFPVDDGKDKLMLSVVNRGDMPTTITHMIGFGYASRWKRLLRKPEFTGIIAKQSLPDMQPPHELAVNRQWMGIMNYDERLSAYRAKGLLYVGVIASHSNRNFLARVPPPKKDVPTQKIG